MSEPFRCWLPGEPVPQARPRVVVGRRGGVHAFTPAKSAAYRNWCVLQLRRANSGKAPLQGALAVTLMVFRVRPKSNKSSLPQVRPDVDNYIKQVLDALRTAGVLHDDGQVCRVYATKHWDCDGKPGVDVTVETI